MTEPEDEAVDGDTGDVQQPYLGRVLRGCVVASGLVNGIWAATGAAPFGLAVALSAWSVALLLHLWVMRPVPRRRFDDAPPC
jgi:hypothetical protein